MQLKGRDGYALLMGVLPDIANQQTRNTLEIVSKLYHQTLEENEQLKEQATESSEN